MVLFWNLLMVVDLPHCSDQLFNWPFIAMLLTSSLVDTAKIIYLLGAFEKTKNIEWI